jgi:hypothetical protein
MVLLSEILLHIKLFGKNVIFEDEQLHLRGKGKKSCTAGHFSGLAFWLRAGGGLTTSTKNTHKLHTAK